MIDLRQTKNYANFLKKIGWKIESLKINDFNLQVFIKKIPLLPFSFIKIQRPKVIDLKKIKRVAAKHRALIVKIEPDLKTTDRFFKDAGFKQDKHSMLPAKTIWVNLEKTERQIFKNFKKDTRYCLKKAQKHPLQIIEASRGYTSGILPSTSLKLKSAEVDIKADNSRTYIRGISRGRIESNDIKVFHQLLRKNCRLGRFFTFPLKHLKALEKTFKKNFLLLLALDKNKKPLAGAVILYSPKAAYYYLAATSKEGRKLLAQYPIVWEAIKESKKAGKTIFDMEGIYDERFPQKNWLGFSHFKKSFGGQEVKYPGCFSKRFFS